MSDLLIPEHDARPWLPAGNVAVLTTLNEYNIPLAGLIEQGGTTFLYVCLLGELEKLNMWAYSRPSQHELDQLTSLADDDLATAIDAALADRVLVAALAHDHQLVNWVRIDVGVAGTLALAKRFVDQMHRRLEAEQQEVDELERQQALANL